MWLKVLEVRWQSPLPELWPHETVASPNSFISNLTNRVYNLLHFHHLTFYLMEGCMFNHTLNQRKERRKKAKKSGKKEEKLEIKFKKKKKKREGDKGGA